MNQRLLASLNAATSTFAGPVMSVHDRHDKADTLLRDQKHPDSTSVIQYTVLDIHILDVYTVYTVHPI